MMSCFAFYLLMQPILFLFAPARLDENARAKKQWLEYGELNGVAYLAITYLHTYIRIQMA